MSHAVFTIVTEVRDGAEDDLRALLASIDGDQRGNPHIRFHEFSCVHFASFTVFPGAESPREPALLVFENNVDGTLEQYLHQLTTSAVSGLTAIYEHCAGAPAQCTRESLYAYLHAHRRLPNLHHVGTPYRRADTIVADAELRDAIETSADALAATGGSPQTIWQRLKTALAVPGSRSNGQSPVVAADRTVSWISRPERRWPTRLRRWSVFVTLVVLALAAVWTMVAVVWTSQPYLTLVLVSLFLALGAWASVLLGWPAGGRWRDPLNVWIWFGVAGWAVSLLPAAFRLAGIAPGWFPGWLGQLTVAGLSIGILAFLVGVWSLPTPELDRPVPASEDLAMLKVQEDRHVINHMSAMVILRPGLHRRLALRLLLWTLEHTWFHTVLADVQKGKLFNFSTVHFAQWVMLDRTRYMFLSNYDHSWSRYLDDFGNISFGLARLWGQGDRSPGLTNLECFKDFSRTWMRPYSVWYRAYPDTSVTQVWNNEQLRLGLLAEPGAAECEVLLDRLVCAGNR